MANTSAAIDIYEELLEETNEEIINEYAPVIAYIVFVIMLGTIGNIITVIFYGFKTKKSTNTVLITSLASIDLVSCVIWSDEVIDICYSITFKSVEGCRLKYFMNHWLVSSSVFVLWVICLDRYRKVCKYFARQFNMFSVKIAVGISIGCALLLSIPNTVFREIVRLNVTNSNGHTVRGFYCTRSDDEKLEITFTILDLIDLVILAVITFSFIILYILVVRTILRSQRKTHSTAVKYTVHENPTSVDDSNDTSVTIVEDNASQHETNVKNNINKQNNESNAKVKEILSFEKVRHMSTVSPKENAHVHAEIRITLMMIAITVGYLISFTPYFVVNLAVRSNSSANGEFNVGVQLAMRSFLLNSAINPYIICAFNPVFRRFVTRIICSCRFKNKSYNTSITS